MGENDETNEKKKNIHSQRRPIVSMSESRAKYRPLHRLQIVDTFIVVSECAGRSSENFAKVNSLFLHKLGNRMNIYVHSTSATL